MGGGGGGGGNTKKKSCTKSKENRERDGIMIEFSYSNRLVKVNITIFLLIG